MIFSTANQPGRRVEGQGRPAPQTVGINAKRDGLPFILGPDAGPRFGPAQRIRSSPVVPGLREQSCRASAAGRDCKRKTRRRSRPSAARTHPPARPQSAWQSAGSPMRKKHIRSAPACEARERIADRRPTAADRGPSPCRPPLSNCALRWRPPRRTTGRPRPRREKEFRSSLCRAARPCGRRGADRNAARSSTAFRARANWHRAGLPGYWPAADERPMHGRGTLAQWRQSSAIRPADVPAISSAAELRRLLNQEPGAG